MTENETSILLELVGKYKTVIENKKTDGASTKAKHDAWERLTSQYNCMHGVVHRNTKQLRKAWDNLKVKWKREAAKGMRKTMATGRCTYVPFGKRRFLHCLVSRRLWYLFCLTILFAS